MQFGEYECRSGPHNGPLCVVCDYLRRYDNPGVRVALPLPVSSASAVVLRQVSLSFSFHFCGRRLGLVLSVSNLCTDSSVSNLMCDSSGGGLTVNCSYSYSWCYSNISTNNVYSVIDCLIVIKIMT